MGAGRGCLECPVASSGWCGSEYRKLRTLVPGFLSLLHLALGGTLGEGMDM